jgi:hypothetical protein
MRSIRSFSNFHRNLPVGRQVWLAVGRFAVGCLGSNEAANLPTANQISMKIELKTKNLHFRANLLYTLKKWILK